MRQRLSSYLLLLFLIPQLGGCANSYPVAKITLHVVNQDGKPVSDTKIEAGFWMGRDNLSAYPDKEGFVSFQSPAMGDAVFSNTLLYHPIRNPDVKDKYYLTIFRHQYTSPSKNVMDGKWQPWNPTLKMVLKEYVNPIPMYATGITNRIELPALNQWIGFDFEQNDWISPWGTGTTCDLEVKCTWDGVKGETYNGYQVELRMMKPYAGMCPFVRDKTSGLQSPYRASLSADYQHQMVFYERREKLTNGFSSNEFDITKGLTFRTRTTINDKGQLQSARYGKLYGVEGRLLHYVPGKPKMSITLVYYFNPTENDTNIEFDPKHNLLKHVRGHIEP